MVVSEQKQKKQREIEAGSYIVVSTT